MKYEITFEQPLSHLINIKLRIENIKKNQLEIYLPFWRPGRYEGANYSKNIRSVTFEDENSNPLAWQKRDANMWLVETSGAKNISVTYQYFAFAMDAGNSLHDDELIYINFINCLFFVPEKIREACEVRIDLPESYKVGCSLRQESKNVFYGKSYYELVDSPLIASNSLECIKYDIQDVSFSLWLNGEHDLDLVKLKDHFKSFSKSQIEAFGSFPEDEYHFLLLFTPYKHYHGVEHGASTVIVIGPGNELSKKEVYKELLGVSSHELFHAWNIIKIRPQELMPYDFTKPVAFSTGYVAEGFTTYYGDLFLSRSGVFDKTAYLNELNTLLNRHFWNFGRYNESVMTSSMNLWVDGYVPGAPNKKSSIYVEGAMVALMLDLLIRKESDFEKSLDDVMRLLWKKFGITGKGYTHRDIKESCEEIIDQDMGLFFKKYVETTEDKYEPINTLLSTVGCEITHSENENPFSRYLGIRAVQENDDYLKVTQIAPRSLGERYFSVNDKIKESDRSLLMKSEKKICLEIVRNHKTVALEVEYGKETYFKNNSVSQLQNASEKQKELFKSWTGHTF